MVASEVVDLVEGTEIQEEDMEAKVDMEVMVEMEDMAVTEVVD